MRAGPVLSKGLNPTRALRAESVVFALVSTSMGIIMPRLLGVARREAATA